MLLGNRKLGPDRAEEAIEPYPEKHDEQGCRNRFRDAALLEARMLPQQQNGQGQHGDDDGARTQRL